MTQAVARAALEVLLFEVDGQRYALPSSVVLEVLRAVALVPLPKAPPIVEGAVNVRGAVVAVLDIRTRVRRSPKAIEPSDHLVLALAGARRVALRADRALGLLHLEPAQVEDAKVALPSAEYLAGVAKLADGLVLLHDLDRFLTEAEAETLDEALSPAPAEPGG